MRPAHATARRTAALTALAAAFLVPATAVLAAGPAAAHNVVVDTTPATDGTVTTAPDEVSVTFDDVVLDVSADGSSTAVQVTDAQGAEHATGCATTRDRTIAVPVELVDPGDYTVSWRVVSADGHPTSGEFTFTYAPEDGAAGSGAGDDAGQAGTAPTAGCAEGAAGSAGDGAADTGAADTTDTAPAASSDLLVVLGIAGGVVVLAGGGVLVALRLSRRRG